MKFLYINASAVNGNCDFTAISNFPNKQSKKKKKNRVRTLLDSFSSTEAKKHLNYLSYVE